MIDSAVTLLPEPDSPTMATVSPGVDVERHLVDGRHPPALGVEARRQVADLQEGCGMGMGPGAGGAWLRRRRALSRQ